MKDYLFAVFIVLTSFFVMSLITENLRFMRNHIENRLKEQEPK